MTNKNITAELLEFALRDFALFCSVTDCNPNKLAVCLLKSKGKTYQQIAIALGISRDAAIGLYKRNCGRLQPQKAPKLN